MSVPKSGNGGTLSIKAVTTYDIKSWSRSVVADNQAYVSSQTSGRNYRVAGNLDGTFSISLYAPDGAMLGHDTNLEPGEIAAIVATTDGVHSWSGNIIIDSVEVLVNVETGENIGIEITGSAVDSTSYAYAT